MIVSINDENGGPAFPVTNWSALGMSLRDYFAAAALQGMMASCTQQNWKEEFAATVSYELADAMLEVREAKP